jgi:4-methoxybenzoate monooxygenase (O-demethylating)
MRREYRGPARGAGPVYTCATPVTSDLDPFSDAFLDEPFAPLRQLRDAGPVVWLEPYRVYAMARHEQVEAALRDPGTYCSRRGVGLADFAREKPWRPPSLLLEADPPEHDRARRVVGRVLAPKTIRAMRDTFAAHARALIELLVGAGTFDGIDEIARRYPLDVFPDAVGLTEQGREHLLAYGGMVFNGFGPRNAHFERAMTRGAAARDWVMANTKREALAPDQLGARLHALAADEGFSEEEAGLRSDPSRARAAFEEVIRYESPVQMFFRTTTRPVQVDGETVPDGEKVLLFLASANRDHRRWEDPDRFDIGRSSSGHIGFGAGIHACVGRMLARLEGELLLSALAERVAGIELDGEPRRELNNNLRGLDALPLRLAGA